MNTSTDIFGSVGNAPGDGSARPPLNPAALDPDVDPLMAQMGDAAISPIHAEIPSENKVGAPASKLNSFLRGEISAVEAYRIAIEKLSVAVQPNILDVSILRQIQLEHGRTAQALRDRIHELGGAAADNSGFWGTWAKFIMEAAKMFGASAVVKMLQEGEEHGMKDFRSGLDEVDNVSAHLIQNQFIPAQQRHIEVLQAMLGAQEQ